MIEKLNSIPAQSIMKENEVSYHYIDSFRGDYKNPGLEDDIVDMGKLFFNSSPQWANQLMTLRDKIVGKFGLKTASQLTADQKNVDHFKFEPGERLGIFKLYIRTDNELIMGEDDKHLNFRFSLLLDPVKNDLGNKTITLTTMVEFKNLFGRLYFMAVKPFHQLILKSTLKKMILKAQKH